MERNSPTWSSPLLAKRADGSMLIVLLADPDVTAWDPETGEQVWSTKVLTGKPDFCVGPSPVQVDDMVFVNAQNSGMFGLNLAEGSIAWSLDQLPDGSGVPDGASMTTDGKYLYFTASIDQGPGLMGPAPIANKNPTTRRLLSK